MKERNVIVGIDPGESGGIAMLDLETKKILYVTKVKGLTELDIINILDLMYSTFIRTVYLEKVHAMPKQGVSSTFKFGKNYGFNRGVVLALRKPLIDVPPSTWQRHLGCLTGGDKNVTKSFAQQLYPDTKITHAIADAILIALYGCHHATIKG